MERNIAEESLRFIWTLTKHSEGKLHTTFFPWTARACSLFKSNQTKSNNRVRCMYIHINVYYVYICIHEIPLGTKDIKKGTRVSCVKTHIRFFCRPARLCRSNNVVCLLSFSRVDKIIRYDTINLEDDNRYILKLLYIFW